jgi:hypothetical protein
VLLEVHEGDMIGEEILQKIEEKSGDKKQNTKE